MTDPHDRSWGIESARIDWRDGRPRSRDYGDIYHAVDGMQESMQVFVGLNRLEQRFRRMQHHRGFRIGELGFGAGLNFVCAVERFLRNAPEHARLLYMSVEKHPLTLADLTRASRQHPLLASCYQELIACYPAPVPGWHRLQLFGERVSLSLHYGEARAALASLDAAGTAPMDCWFLDGFAPDRNPEMWQESLLARVAQLSAAGTTLATFSVAGRLRRSLQHLGFRVRRVSGAPRKRHLLAAEYGGAARDRETAPETVTVIGAGIAGACAARALAARGHRVVIIAPQTEPAGGLGMASDNPAATLHPRLLPGTQPLSRLRAKAFDYASAYYRGLNASARASFWHPIGLAQLPGPNTPPERLEAIADTFSRCHWMHGADAATLSSIAGRGLATAGLWFPRSGWIDLASACRDLVAHRAITGVRGRAVELRRDDRWHVVRDCGDVIESDHVVVATGPFANTFSATRALPLALVAGQLTTFHCIDHGLRCVVSGDGYLAPLARDRLAAGATYLLQDYEALPDAAGRDANRARLHSMLGEIDGIRFAGDFAALRATSRDARPLAGTLGTRLHVSLAHASHGTVTGPLAAEIIASEIDREPPPLDAEELALLDPNRFS